MDFKLNKKNIKVKNHLKMKLEKLKDEIRKLQDKEKRTQDEQKSLLK